MKNIIKFITVVGMLGLLSQACTLDRYPTTQLVAELAFETFEDAENFRNGIYNELRRNRYSIFVTTSELMSDLFNASVGFGNRGGIAHRLDRDLTMSFEARDIWRNMFASITQVNNFLGSIGRIEVAPGSEQERLINIFIAEAHYARAFLYSELAAYFMYPLRDQTTTWNGRSADEEHLGLPLVTEFDVNYRPGRASIAETFAFIMADIEAAEAGLIGGMPGAPRVTQDAVRALKARVFFMMRNHARAAHYADMVIGTGRYPLVTTEATLTAMWRDDNSTEDIFLLNATLTEFGAAFGSPPGGGGVGWFETNMRIFSAWQNATQTFAPDFLPTQTVLDLYEPDDLRLSVFFSDPETQQVRYGAIDHDVRFLSKFPGNPALRAAGAPTNDRHRQRMHRIAEMYLIYAEATQTMGRLNELRVARGASDLGATWNEDALREEWVREFVGEGFRIRSLRRWGIGFNGRVPQNVASAHLPGNPYFTARHVTPEQFYRFTLPIPSHDLQTNHNLRQTPSWASPQ